MADSLISLEVGSNRCSCQKWDKLRQDSSYSAYPWLQHCGKCLASTSGKYSFQPPRAHNGHADHQGDTAVGSIQESSTIAVDNPVSEAQRKG
ncbi:hypothetical protein M378DRAFT_171177 [Amanita muscaria Koide BX008]|uniref:Uncharacterized protein n=1 Tax=Amanita muscaria (strain Koide BX008) TaxID=946122 RepID=A0A0C2WMM2_AMAMK|nr:hypothetical protein M378DRAFT_171177 [Amanita muscaria Koide BX008]